MKYLSFNWLNLFLPLLFSFIHLLILSSLLFFLNLLLLLSPPHLLLLCLFSPLHHPLLFLLLFILLSVPFPSFSSDMDFILYSFYNHKILHSKITQGLQLTTSLRNRPDTCKAFIYRVHFQWSLKDEPIQLKHIVIISGLASSLGIS